MRRDPTNGRSHEHRWHVFVAMQIVLVLALGALEGCTSFDKSVATGYGLNIVSRDLSAELLDADKLSSADGKRIKKVNDEVSDGLWKAWQIRKTYPDSAKATAKQYLDSVKEVFNYLKEKEVANGRN